MVITHDVVRQNAPAAPPAAPDYKAVKARQQLTWASGDYAVVGVHVDADDAGGPEAVSVVREVRATDPGFEVWVTGQAAGQVDFLDALGERVWWAVGIVVGAMALLGFGGKRFLDRFRTPSDTGGANSASPDVIEGEYSVVEKTPRSLNSR